MAAPKTLKKSREIGAKDQILFDVTRLPGREEIAFGSSDFRVYTVDLTEEKPQPTPLGDPEKPESGHTSYVTGVVATDSAIITAGYDRRIIFWNPETRQPIRRIDDAHDRWIRRLALSPDGSIVASVGDDMQCHLWDTRSGKKIRTVSDHEPVTPHNYPSMLYAVAFTPDGKHFATGDRVGHVAIWETATGKQVGSCESPIMYTWDPRARRHSIGGIRSLAFSPDGQQLAVGGMGKVGNIDHLGGPSRIELFDWQTGTSQRVFEDGKYKGLVEQMTYHSSGKWLLAVGGDNSGFCLSYDPNSEAEFLKEKAPMHVHAALLEESTGELILAGHGKLALMTLE